MGITQALLHGGVAQPDGGILLPDGSIIYPDAEPLRDDTGDPTIPDGSTLLPDGRILYPNGCIRETNGTVNCPAGDCVADPYYSCATGVEIEGAYFLPTFTQTGSQSVPNLINPGAPGTPVAGKTVIHLGQWDNTYVSKTVNTYEIDIDAGTYTSLSSYNVVSSNDNFSYGTSDISCFVAGVGGTTLRVYDGNSGTTTYSITLPESGLGTLRFWRIGDTIVFGAPLFGLRKIYKYSLSTGTQLAVSSALATYTETLVVLGSYVYVASTTAADIYVLNLSDLTLVTTYTEVAASGSRKLFVYDGTLFCYGASGGSIYCLTEDGWRTNGSNNASIAGGGVSSGYTATFHQYGTKLAVFGFNGSSPHRTWTTTPIAVTAQTVFIAHAENTSDSSCANPKTITLTGSASVSSAEKKFGTNSFLIPYNAFSNTNGVQVTGVTDFDFYGVDWTIRFWAYRLGNSGNRFLIKSTASSGVAGISSLFNGTGLFDPQIITNSASSYSPTVSGVSFPSNTWVEFLYQRRDCTNLDFYVGGTRAATITISILDRFKFTNNWFFGREEVSGVRNLDGYIDEIHIVRGVAEVSGTTYTPNTVPFCDSTSAPSAPRPTSGLEPLTGQSIIVTTGTLRVDNSQVVLNGLSSTTALGYIGFPGNRPTNQDQSLAVYYNATTNTTVTVSPTLNFSSAGTVQYSYTQSGSISSANYYWITPQGGGVGDDFEVYLSIENNADGFTLTNLPLNIWVPGDTGFTNALSVSITSGNAGSTITKSCILRVQVRPISASPNFGNLYFEADYELTLTVGIIRI